MTKLYQLLTFQSFLCPGCEQPQANGRMCDVCVTYLSRISLPCQLCGKPDTPETYCGKCLQKKPSWDKAVIPWHFNGLTRHLIHQFKYHNNMAAAYALLDLWPKPSNTTDINAIIAVPMHHKKEAKKGYNHAQMLAERLSKTTGIPVWRGLKRSVSTPPLEGLSKKQRRAALKNAFNVKQPPPKSVAIVDDVFTSGSTAQEISQLLKRNGTQMIEIWTLARTPLG